MDFFVELHRRNPLPYMGALLEGPNPGEYRLVEVADDTYADGASRSETLVPDVPEPPMRRATAPAAPASTPPEPLLIDYEDPRPLRKAFFNFVQSKIRDLDHVIEDTQITTARQLFNHALAQGIATPATEVLELVVGDVKIYVLRDHTMYFDRMKEIVGRSKRRSRHDVIVAVKNCKWK